MRKKDIRNFTKNLKQTLPEFANNKKQFEHVIESYSSAKTTADFMANITKEMPSDADEFGDPKHPFVAHIVETALEIDQSKLYSRELSNYQRRKISDGERSGMVVKFKEFDKEESGFEEPKRPFNGIKIIRVY